MKKRPPEGLLYFLAFLLIASVYFYRMFTEGAAPISADGLQWIYPTWLFDAKTGLLPTVWTRHMFAGMPFIALMQTASLYPLKIVLYAVLPAKHAFNAGILIHYALAGTFAFMYLREIGLGRLPAFSGGAAFAFSGFVISTTSHVAVLNSSVWLPLIVLFAERLKKSLGVRHTLAISLAIAVQVFAGNFQMCVYTYLVLAVYFAFSVFDVPEGKRFRFMSLGALGALLGFLIAFPQIYATRELSGISMRPVVKETLGYLFTQEFHVYLRTLPSLVFPHLYSRSDFGTLLPVPDDRMIVFAGILPLSLAVLALLKGFGKSSTIRLWAAVGVLGLVLAAADDTALGGMLFHVPVYGMFHASGRNMLEFSLALSVLFAVGLDYIFSDGRLSKAALKIMAGIAVAAAISLAVTYFVLGSESEKALTLGNPALYVPALFFMLYALGLALYHAKRKQIFIYALLALALAEAYSFGAHHGAVWTPASSLDPGCEERGYDYLQGIAGDEQFRAAVVEDVWRDQFNLPCGLSTFNSYDQLIPKDYAVLFDMETFGLSRYWDNLLAGNSLLSMMNVKYLLVSSSRGSSLENIETVTGEVSADAVAGWPGPFDIPDPRDATRNRVTFMKDLGEGTHAVKMKASPRAGEKASLRMEVYRKEQAALRDAALPFNPYPGIIRKGDEEYYRIYQSDRPDVVIISFTSLLKEDIGIRDIGVFKLDDYGPPSIATSGKVYELLGKAGGYDVYLNKNALPRAYSVTGLVGARDIYEIKRMFDFNEVNPATQAVLFEKDLNEIGGKEFFGAEVSVAGYGNERAVLRTSSPGTSFIVLADQYYPGWKATVDGEETRIWKANGVLRGVVVPEGEHEVVFEYSPLWLRASIFASLLIVAMAIFVIFRGRREGES